MNNGLKTGLYIPSRGLRWRRQAYYGSQAVYDTTNGNMNGVSSRVIFPVFESHVSAVMVTATAAGGVGDATPIGGGGGAACYRCILPLNRGRLKLLITAQKSAAGTSSTIISLISSKAESNATPLVLYGIQLDSGTASGGIRVGGLARGYVNDSVTVVTTGTNNGNVPLCFPFMNGFLVAGMGSNTTAGPASPFAPIFRRDGGPADNPTSASGYGASSHLYGYGSAMTGDSLDPPPGHGSFQGAVGTFSSGPAVVLLEWLE